MGDPIIDESGGIAAPVSLPLDAEHPVEIHKPKAVHGWRELANEIGVIVIGVLIALGAEQVVESLHWHHQVGQARNQLREDAVRIAKAAVMRKAATPCIGHRLDEITALVDKASLAGRLPAVGQLGNPPASAWVVSAWGGIVAAQTTAHFDHDQMLEYSAMAGQGDGLVLLNAKETDDWTDLYVIVGPGRTFLPAEQATVRAAISRSVVDAKRLWKNADDILSTVTDSELIEKDEMARIRRDTDAEYARYAAEGIMCKPLKDAPPSPLNGQSPIHIDLAHPSY